METCFKCKFFLTSPVLDLPPPPSPFPPSFPSSSPLSLIHAKQVFYYHDTFQPSVCNFQPPLFSSWRPIFTARSCLFLPFKNIKSTYFRHSSFIDFPWSDCSPHSPSPAMLFPNTIGVTCQPPLSAGSQSSQ